MDVFSELNRAQAENIATDPVPSIKGRFYYKNSAEPLKIDDGTDLHKVVTDRNIATHVSSSTVQAFVPFAPQLLGRVVGNVTTDMDDVGFNQLRGLSATTYGYASGGIFRIDSGDFPVVPGKTAKIRIKAQLFTNDTAIGATVKLGLYPVTRPTVSGGSDDFMLFTVGAVVAGSNDVEFVLPAVDSSLVDTGAGFSVPGDGFYAIYFKLSALTGPFVPLGARAQIVADLQLIYV